MERSMETPVYSRNTVQLELAMTILKVDSQSWAGDHLVEQRGTGALFTTRSFLPWHQVVCIGHTGW